MGSFGFVFSGKIAFLIAPGRFFGFVWKRQFFDSAHGLLRFESWSCVWSARAGGADWTRHLIKRAGRTVEGAVISARVVRGRGFEREGAKDSRGQGAEGSERPRISDHRLGTRFRIGGGASPPRPRRRRAGRKPTGIHGRLRTAKQVWDAVRSVMGIIYGVARLYRRSVVKIPTRRGADRPFCLALWGRNIVVRGVSGGTMTRE